MCFETDATLNSINRHRLKDNPLEKRFVDRWEEDNRMGRTLEYILSNDNTPVVPSDRDVIVAKTVIQWLGSPVGQGFLSQALGFDVRDRIPREVLEQGRNWSNEE